MTKLSRAEQDYALMSAVMACRTVCWHMGADKIQGENTLESFRAALRLDDDKLDKIIAERGTERWDWSSSSRL